MTAANTTSAWVYRQDLVIVALASQGLLCLGFLVPVLRGLKGDVVRLARGPMPPMAGC